VRKTSISLGEFDQNKFNYSLQGRNVASLPSRWSAISASETAKTKLDLPGLLMEIADDEECVRRAPCQIRIDSRACLSLTSLNGMVGIGLLRGLSAANIERRTSRRGWILYQSAKREMLPAQFDAMGHERTSR
jgi:hypothetical protein